MLPNIILPNAMLPKVILPNVTRPLVILPKVQAPHEDILQMVQCCFSVRLARAGFKALPAQKLVVVQTREH
jgi:hypothetical protein